MKIKTALISVSDKRNLKPLLNVLKKNNHVTDGYLSPPKGKETKTWKKTKRLIFK